MNTTELLKKVMAGETLLIGKFLGCTIETSRGGKQTRYESTKIQGSKRNFEFKRWARKTDTAELVPQYKFAVGLPVVVTDFGDDVKDGYLQHDCIKIDAITDK